MKLKGPFSVGIYKSVPVLLDSAARHLLHSQRSTGDFDDDHDTVKRIAAALNRDAKARRKARCEATQRDIDTLKSVADRISAGEDGFFNLFPYGATNRAYLAVGSVSEGKHMAGLSAKAKLLAITAAISMLRKRAK